MRRITRRQFVEGSAALAGAGLLSGMARQPAGQGTAEVGPAASAIPRRPLGRTGVEVTVVGVGGGSRFYEPVKDDEAGAELVRRAIDGGISLVETSANYGPGGASEVRIGMAMKTHRAKVFLETKVDARDHDGAMREMERSLRRLQTDHLDLVLHHNILSGAEIDAVLAAGGAERAIRRMVDQKVVRFRGLSCHVPAVVLYGIDRLRPDVIQVPINATRVPDFEAGVLSVTEERGIGVVAMKTCGHGYFLPANTTRPDRIDQYGAPREALARPDLPTPGEYLHYALSLPIATAVVGTDSLATIEGVIQSATTFAALGAAGRAAITRRAQVFRTTGYWIGG